MADQIKWSSQLETGVDRVDHQHQTLISIINRLNAAIKSKADRTGLSLIFGQLASYTKFHFKAEEMIIAQVQKHSLEKHQLLHKDFVNKLRGYEKKFRAGETIVISDLLEYLNEWLVNHIINEDCRILGHKQESPKIDLPKLSKKDEMSDWEWVLNKMDKTI